MPNKTSLTSGVAREGTCGPIVANKLQEKKWGTSWNYSSYSSLKETFKKMLFLTLDDVS